MHERDIFWPTFSGVKACYSAAVFSWLPPQIYFVQRKLLNLRDEPKLCISYKFGEKKAGQVLREASD